MENTNCCIWHVDDDPISRLLVARQIGTKHPKLNVKQFKNGLEAYEHLVRCIENEELLPQAILLDLEMPILDGYGFLQALYNLRLAVKPPIIVHSSESNAALIEKAQKFNDVVAFLPKPFNDSCLSKIVKIAS